MSTTAVQRRLIDEFVDAWLPEAWEKRAFAKRMREDLRRLLENAREGKRD